MTHKINSKMQVVTSIDLSCETVKAVWNEGVNKIYLSMFELCERVYNVSNYSQCHRCAV